MAYRHGILLVLLATAPALADDAQFLGHVIETDGAADARQVLREAGLSDPEIEKLL